MKKLLIVCSVVLAASCSAEAGESLQNRSRPPSSFDAESPSADTRHTLAWILTTRNNAGLPFVILDKKAAKVFVFQSDGQLRGAAPALIGAAIGDASAAGIGERALSAILLHERTTPAGRFVAALGRNLQNRQILWVDYDLALSLHVVTTSDAREQRAQRLASATPLDNRISYGCINVNADFFKRIVLSTFNATNGIFYILPETHDAMKFFAGPAAQHSAG